MISIHNFSKTEEFRSKFNLVDELGFILVTEGNLNIKLNEKNVKLSSKHYLILNSYDMLEINKNSNTSYLLFKLKLKDLKRISNNNNLETFFNIDKNNLYSRLFEATPYVESLLLAYNRQFNDLVSKHSDIANLQIDAWTILLLAHLIEETDKLNRKTKHSKIFIKDITDFYKQEITNPNLNLSFVAESFGVTTSYLSKFYKKESGQNLSEAITKYRLSLALDYLKKGFSVFESYDQAGFNTYNNFFKQFKKFYNMSPLEYLDYLETN